MCKKFPNEQHPHQNKSHADKTRRPLCQHEKAEVQYRQGQDYQNECSHSCFLLMAASCRREKANSTRRQSRNHQRILSGSEELETGTVGDSNRNP